MKYHIITLGCPKNTVDSEGMHGILAREGHTAVDEAAAADVVIVNTCSFIAAARDETIGVLQDLAAHKGPEQKLIAAGCMAESHGELVRSAVPQIDATLSTKEWMRIGQIIQGTTGTISPSADLGIPLLTPSTGMNLTLTPVTSTETLGTYGDWRTTAIKRYGGGPSAYLKISDGCNLRCAFCTIPSFKGDMRSKAMGAILGEARELVDQGVQEIVLVAQHLTDYGRDLGMKQHGLATLLAELAQVVPADRWIRLMYAYPQSITPELVETMARYQQICHYIDMPLQHAHPDTLRRMRRPPDTERTKAIIASIRDAMPDVALRTTFIVGYPGETRTEFQALLDFLAEQQFDRVGMFKYSLEPGTPAAALADQIQERVKEKRWNEAMALQQSISAERIAPWQGRTMRMLVEGTGQDETGQALLVGRSFRDAPEVDGLVFAYGTAETGTFVEVEIEQTTAYDVWGRVV